MTTNRVLAALLAVLLSTVSIFPPNSRADIVDNARVLQLTPAHTRLQAALARQDVADQLTSLGVDPQEARDRAAALTEAEARQLADELDRLPTGGDGVGALIFIFLVLLVTDILGYTDVYPFVTRTVNGDK